MIKDSPNAALDSTSLHAAAHRAINHYLNPSFEPDPPGESSRLFVVREGLDVETLLVNASEDLSDVGGSSVISG